MNSYLFGDKSLRYTFLPFQILITQSRCALDPLNIREFKVSKFLIWGRRVGVGLVHTQLCSGFIPGFVLRDYSWWCFGDIMMAGLKPGCPHTRQVTFPLCYSSDPLNFWMFTSHCTPYFQHILAESSILVQTSNTLNSSLFKYPLCYPAKTTSSIIQPVQ